MGVVHFARFNAQLTTTPERDASAASVAWFKMSVACDAEQAQAWRTRDRSMVETRYRSVGR